MWRSSYVVLHSLNIRGRNGQQQEQQTATIAGQSRSIHPCDGMWLLLMPLLWDWAAARDQGDEFDELGQRALVDPARGAMRCGHSASPFAAAVRCTLTVW